MKTSVSQEPLTGAAQGKKGGPAPDGARDWRLVYHQCPFDTYGDWTWEEVEEHLRRRYSFIKSSIRYIKQYKVVSEYYGILPEYPRIRIDKWSVPEPGNMWYTVEVFYSI
jgi:hypothetical protein